jgi:hypothetical protein
MAEPRRTNGRGLTCDAENWAFFYEWTAISQRLSAESLDRAIRLNNRIPDVVKTSLGD